jgi:hypothetical protein
MSEAVVSWPAARNVPIWSRSSLSLTERAEWRPISSSIMSSRFVRDDARGVPPPPPACRASEPACGRSRIASRRELIVRVTMPRRLRIAL